MSTCHVQASGAIELLFYEELDPVRRASVEEHLRSCAECRSAWEELGVIRDALSARPVVEAPPDGDWTAFMSRLNVALESSGPAAAPVVSPGSTNRLVPLLAMAALLALATMSVVSLVMWRAREDARVVTTAETAVQPAASTVSGPVGSRDAAFAALSEQHLERSKLVVLKLASGRESGADLSYERRLAETLLNDTRLYRLTAEERGMTALARVMGDLELVLLQTSMSDTLDADAVGQIQRLIRTRDLVTRMNAVARVGGM
jgi:hypothetical protein